MNKLLMTPTTRGAEYFLDGEPVTYEVIEDKYNSYRQDKN